MKNFILSAAVIGGLVISGAAGAETTVTRAVTPDGSTTTTTTTTYNRATDTDPRVAAIQSERDFNSYAYSRWDQNNDGVITPNEWDYNVTRWYAPGTTTYKTYNEWDVNRDSRLDTAEFDTVMNRTGLYKTWNVRSVTTTAPAPSADDSFAIHDLNGDGSITPSEWKATFNR